MGEREPAVGVRARPGDPAPHVLRYRADVAQPAPTDGEDRVVFRLTLEQAGQVRARVDIPLAAAVVVGCDPDQVRRVVGTLAARQLSRLAARARLPLDAALLPLRLVGLDPHVVRLLHQPELPMDAEAGWVVLA